MKYGVMLWGIFDTKVLGPFDTELGAKEAIENEFADPREDTCEHAGIFTLVGFHEYVVPMCPAV